MRLRIFLLVLFLGIGSWSRPIVADNHIPQGMVVENFFHIKNTYTQIALPPGKWEVAATTEVANNIATYMLSVVLFQEIGGVISKIVYFKTPLERNNGGYVESKYCSRNNLHYRETISSASGGDQECRWINHYRLTLSGSKSKLKNAAGDYIRERNITVPNHLILSGYRFADADKFLDVWYLVNPQFDGFPSYQRTSWTDSPWHPHSVATDPKKKAYIDRLKVWTEEWHQRVRAGFDEKLTGAAIQIPAKPTVSASPASESSSVADRLKQLDALFKKELISKEEYEQRRKQILDSL